MLPRQFAYCSKICDADGNEPSKKVIKRSLVRAVKNFGRVPKTDNTWRKRVPFLTPTQCKNIWGKLWPKDVQPEKFTETIDKIMQKLKCDEHLEEDQAILDECKQWTEWKELHAEAENKEAEKKQENRYFLSHAGRQALRRVKAEVSAGSDRIKEPSPNFKLPTMDELARLFPDVIEVGPIQPGRISTSSTGPAKAIIEFGRFLRLHEAQAAWHRRLVQENTFAALGWVTFTFVELCLSQELEWGNICSISFHDIPCFFACFWWLSDLCPRRSTMCGSGVLLWESLGSRVWNS